VATEAAPAPEDVPVARVAWRPSYRLIPSRFPTVGLFDAIADPADLETVFAIEALGNPRVRDALGAIRLVPPEERVSGPGTTPIMAAFTHLNPEGSRFSDGTWGVYYAAHSLPTAVAEVGHHRARFLARTAEPPIEIDLRLIGANVEAPLHDLVPLARAGRAGAWLDPDAYGASQALARALRAAGSHGLRWPSVRDPGGECVGLFRPKALKPAKALAHVALWWDGERIRSWYEKSAPTALAGLADVASARPPANTDAFDPLG
jgi:hypothetical protein